jgi:hypothetical protein
LGLSLMLLFLVRLLEPGQWFALVLAMQRQML